MTMDAMADGNFEVVSSSGGFGHIGNLRDSGTALAPRNLPAAAVTSQVQSHRRSWTAEEMADQMRLANQVLDCLDLPGLEALYSMLSEGRLGDTTSLPETGATTLILRNLPQRFNQEVTMGWVNDQGYANRYDFLLWFPAKTTSRFSSSSYAFINFNEPEFAASFFAKFHLYRMSPDTASTEPQGLPVSIAIAKVQGFADNHARFKHLENSENSRCSPFFAEEALAALPKDKEDGLGESSSVISSSNSSQDAVMTTVVIRNLPTSLHDQATARELFDEAGFVGLYDFFLFLPAKGQRRSGKHRINAAQRKPYVFVNFVGHDAALRCLEELHGMDIGADSELSVVWSRKVQGLDACNRYFESSATTGRVKPWMPEGVAGDAEADVKSNHYQ
eukprot:CAMPEP_0170583134 /NCGR_PEP_ID=MMETSP0224-20130122/7965_1 /TAXON_ID=285029 /ORGANISM="Togula jolla, Strain CCCM 725" /LENGTH=389 /DNA_ID=CAMNT_0010906425 /DNA_START=32 /DNA_END=1201 /DNA_ORIENTATION=+